ncbi:MAG: diaminopimelate epimerase [Ectothiorhodospiraceae bacterium]|nr:diaminopimelate epimerase [Ectothiorhodospiraceae bacterium]
MACFAVCSINMSDTFIRIPFTKAEGTQNDFVVVDDRKASYPETVRRSFAQAICHRRRGVGADGAIFIDEHPTKSFTMSFFNPDGSDGSMCGNGGRCALLFATTLMPLEGTTHFEAVGDPYSGTVNGRVVRLHFPAPKNIELHRTIEMDGVSLQVHYLDVGAEHAVVFVNDNPTLQRQEFNGLDVDGLGRAIRNHPAFGPKGANANFVLVDGDRLKYRTFEKGVEAETQSCGTGAIASAIAAKFVHDLDAPIDLITNGGDSLRVGFAVDQQTNIQAETHTVPGDSVSDVYFEGEANLVFQGDVFYNPETGRLSTPKIADALLD